MTDNWDSYLCEVDGEPALILVDLGAVAYAPMESFPYLGYVTIELQEPDENGFPRQREYDLMAALEDSLDTLLADADVAVHIGSCTTQGRHELIFYARNLSDWRGKVAEAMSAFPSYDWDANGDYEPNWENYLGFLFPGEHDLLTIQNRRLCRQLQEQGDNLEQVRPILHWLDFTGEEAGEAFCAAVREQGFAVEESIAETLATEAPDTLPDSTQAETSDLGHGAIYGALITRPEQEAASFKVCLSRNDAPRNIDDVSFALMDLAGRHGGEYHGWACAPADEPAPAP